MQDDVFEEVASQSPLLTCSFNQEGSWLAIGTTSGFSLHSLYPQYSVYFQRQLKGGIGLVEMLFRTSLMALVGGGPAPQAPPHRVLIWDDNIRKEIGDLSFRQVVLSVKLRKDAIAVALRDRVYVYHLADLSLRDKIYTSDNPHGLLCLSTVSFQTRKHLTGFLVDWSLTFFSRRLIDNDLNQCSKYKIWYWPVLPWQRVTSVWNCMACGRQL